MTQKIKTFNAIAEKGLNILQEKNFEVSDGLSDPDAIILRSHKLKKEDFGNNLKAIARAGAGVNNIPVEECSELGIPVFNTCLLYTSPSPRDATLSRMPSSA